MINPAAAMLVMTSGARARRRMDRGGGCGPSAPPPPKLLIQVSVREITEFSGGRDEARFMEIDGASKPEDVAKALDRLSSELMHALTNRSNEDE